MKPEYKEGAGIRLSKQKVWILHCSDNGVTFINTTSKIDKPSTKEHYTTGWHRRYLIIEPILEKTAIAAYTPREHIRFIKMRSVMKPIYSPNLQN